MMFVKALLLVLLALPITAANPTLADTLRLAKAGDPKSQYIAGMMYMFGQDTRQNLTEAVAWFSVAAKGGLPHAMVALAALYDVGQGVPLDTARAHQLRRQAAQLGNPTAVGQLDDDRKIRGQAEFRRASTLTDLKLYADAIPYANRAAQAGSANAHLLLGRAHFFALGTPKNLAEAQRHFRAALDGGLSDGAWGLAYMYEFGLGVPVNRATALKYYDQAAAGGNKLARQAAANLRSPDYDRPPVYTGGGGNSTSSCRGDYSYNYASGSCTPMIPGLSPYNP